MSSQQVNDFSKSLASIQALWPQVEQQVTKAEAEKNHLQTRVNTLMEELSAVSATNQKLSEHTAALEREVQQLKANGAHNAQLEGRVKELEAKVQAQASELLQFEAARNTVLSLFSKAAVLAPAAKEPEVQPVVEGEFEEGEVNEGEKTPEVQRPQANPDRVKLDEVVVALTKDPKNVALLIKRGTLEYKLGDYKAANTSFTAVEKLGNTTSAFMQLHAQTYSKLGKHDVAEATIKKAIDREPKNGLLYHTQSEIYSASGKKEQARESAEKAQSLGVQSKK